MSEDGFLYAIRQQPDEDLPRLVYADWLEEQGDNRAEFVRIQCALAAGTVPDGEREAWEAREQEWLGELRPFYLQQLAPLGVQDIRFHRGMIEKIAVQGTRFLDQPRTLALAAPAIRAVIWRGIPFAGGVSALQRFATTAEFSAVRALDLSQNSLNGALLRVLVNQPWFKQVTTLVLSRNQVAGQGIQELAASPYVSGLTQLHLAENELSPQDLTVLSGATSLPRLSLLNLTRNHVSDGGLQALSWSPLLNTLEQLQLGYNEILGPGLRSLANAETVLRATSLDLSGNTLGDAGVSWLATAGNFNRLQTLRLAKCNIGPAGVEALVATPHLKQLQVLDLEGNPLGPAALQLASGKLWKRLTHVSLARTQLSPQSARLLVAAQQAGVPALDLRFNGLESGNISVPRDSLQVQI